MKRLIPSRSIFNFLRTKPIEAKPADSNDLQSVIANQLPIKKEETKLLWELYEPKEEEGLQQFN